MDERNKAASSKQQAGKPRRAKGARNKDEWGKGKTVNK
jgi:hypothetical protein